MMADIGFVVLVAVGIFGSAVLAVLQNWDRDNRDLLCYHRPHRLHLHFPLRLPLQLPLADYYYVVVLVLVLVLLGVLVMALLGLANALILFVCHAFWFYVRKPVVYNFLHFFFFFKKAMLLALSRRLFGNAGNRVLC